MNPQLAATSPVFSSPTEALVLQVKRAQRTSQAWKDEWHRFCDMEGDGFYDPGRKEASFLQRFLEKIGPIDAAPETPEGNELLRLAEEVKSNQRKDAEYKEKWHRFCDLEGRGFYDPKRHELSFLKRFLELHGSKKGSDSRLSISMEPDAKRARL